MSDKQDAHLKLLEEYRRLFGGGNKHALIEALWACLLQDSLEEAPSVFLPEWVKAALMHAYLTFLNAELRSWDEIFGKPFPGKTRKRLLKLRRTMEIWERVEKLKKQGRAVDGILFHDVAAELEQEGRGIGSGSTVRDLYYSIAKYAAKYIAMNADGTWYAIADGDAAK
jgi:hypothetical protein